MAKVVKTETKSQTVGASYSFWQMLMIGIIVGVLFWCFTIMIERYVIDPVYCKSQLDASVCLDAKSISGNVAAIIAGLVGVVAMVRFSMARPLLIVLASIVTLWGLVDWLEGLTWGEAIAWSALLYGLAYVSFSWIARYTRIIPVLVTMVIVIVGVRVVIGL